MTSNIVQNLKSLTIIVENANGAAVHLPGSATNVLMYPIWER